MSQIELIKNHLYDHGYITRAIADVYRVGDLRKPISRLRKQGMNIKTVTKRDATNRPYTRYELRQSLVATHAV